MGAAVRKSPGPIRTNGAGASLGLSSATGGSVKGAGGSSRRRRRQRNAELAAVSPARKRKAGASGGAGFAVGHEANRSLPNEQERDHDHHTARAAANKAQRPRHWPAPP